MEENTVLVVEDEAITAMELQESLQKLGYEVPTIASSGEEAIAIADDINPNLVLMDIILKGKMDGTEAASHISKKKKIPVIFLTAYNDTNTFNRAKLSAPYGYLTKPYEENNLRMAVELALFKHQMEVTSEIETTRLKNEFLRNMSHELRMPMNGINGFLELMYDGKIDINKETIKDILSDSHRLLNLIDGVLELTEIASETREVTSSPIDFYQLIKDIVNTLPAQEKQLEIAMQIDPSLTAVLADSETVKKILYHYLSNAIKFSPPKTKIEVVAHPEGEKQFRIEVKDQGTGIREEDIQHLFKPFQQLDMSASKKHQGAGLGLALAHHLAESRGGKVGVCSAPGKGSTFFALLPRVKQS